MSHSYTYNESNTFTLTHAKHLAAKVSTDLKRIQRFYGGLSDNQIDDYEKELQTLLKLKCLEEITYGFQRQGKFIEPSLKYTSAELSNDNGINDDPGRVRPGADVSNASFCSFLSYSKLQ